MQDLGEAPGRGAALNSAQEPNPWKTPTGFQTGLSGQHEQELSTMTEKKTAQDDKVHGTTGQRGGEGKKCVCDHKTRRQ